MSKKVTIVHIKYNGYSLDLDEVLETALALEGFELTGKGFNLKSEERDLTFQREAEEKGNDHSFAEAMKRISEELGGQPLLVCRACITEISLSPSLGKPETGPNLILSLIPTSTTLGAQEMWDRLQELLRSTIQITIDQITIEKSEEEGQGERLCDEAYPLDEGYPYKLSREGNAMTQETCQQCAGSRLANIIITSKDRNVLTVAGRTTEGYPPIGFGLGGGGDEMAFSWCLDCGQIQGEWPVYPEDED